MTCIKVLRPTEKYCYLDTASTAFPPSPSSPSPSYDSRKPDKNSSGSGIRRSSSSTSYTGSNDTLTLQSVGKSASKDRDRDKDREKEKERDREKDKDKEGRGCKYVSCVTILIDKLLSVFERVRYLHSTIHTCNHSFFVLPFMLTVSPNSLILFLYRRVCTKNPSLHYFSHCNSTKSLAFILAPLQSCSSRPLRFIPIFFSFLLPSPSHYFTPFLPFLYVQQSSSPLPSHHHPPHPSLLYLTIPALKRS